MRCAVTVTALLGLSIASTAWGDETPSPDAPAEVEISEVSRLQYILDAQAQPDQPGLSHRGVAFNFEYLVASAEPTDVTTVRPIRNARAYAYAVRWLVDFPLEPRTWYIGLSSDVAAASVPSGESADSGGSTLVFGNPVLWGRGLWSSESGLSAGGGLEAVVPIPRKYSPLETEVVRVIRVVRPLSYANFRDQALTARPFFDIRHVTGVVTLQMRQGVDFSILVREREDTENRYDLTAHLTAYVGVETFERFDLGLEVAEVYQVTSDVSSPDCVAPCDQHRAQLTVSPMLRARLAPLYPTLSALFPVSTPLRSEVASYWALRLHMNVLFGDFGAPSD
jgi:hypothetical protein